MWAGNHKLKREGNHSSWSNPWMGTKMTSWADGRVHLPGGAQPITAPARVPRESPPPKTWVWQPRVAEQQVCAWSCSKGVLGPGLSATHTAGLAEGRGQRLQLSRRGVKRVPDLPLSVPRRGKPGRPRRDPSGFRQLHRGPLRAPAHLLQI